METNLRPNVLHYLAKPDHYSIHYTPMCGSAVFFGFACLSSCPVAPIICVYLIVGGFLGVTLPVDANWDRVPGILLRIAYAIAGFVWMHFISDLNLEDPQARNYCFKPLFQGTTLFNVYSIVYLSCYCFLYTYQCKSTSSHTDFEDANPLELLSFLDFETQIANKERNFPYSSRAKCNCKGSPNFQVYPVASL